ncbi:glycerophosphodiester phosphodiesterase family protein [Aquimarina sp. RZ0]|uniref:glycerophosphodiester phosphodiesterase n=1 Tax=Aquimarina sp. RZ0 TaxID=2607730 RepID=UPI0011F1BAE5|nr:glycerophosphodiester phosphodiesterase family protein [Aquimarina sp. RZ0]KAA1243883.1 glycerophosphodiester phosphodiesterase [Aquimarina sp. RZ0]
MKIFGHRGAAGLVAENTLESIEEALKHNVDGVEIDVHCCNSGELVVIHDETLDRTTNGSGKVSEYSLVDLQSFMTIEGYRIPTLNQVLELVDGKCELNIELKGVNTALPVMTLLEEYIPNSNWKFDQFIVSSFDHSQLHDIKSVTSQFRIGVLTEDDIMHAISEAKKLEAYSVHPPISSLTEKGVSLAKEEGYEVYVWTVNKEQQIKQSKSWLVDGIITDFPNFA